MHDRIQWTLERLHWLQHQGLWPNGRRCLWTDALGLILLVSLYQRLGEERYLHQAERLVADVERVLGRVRGLCMSEDGRPRVQCFSYLSMWLFALMQLSRFIGDYRLRAVNLVRGIHPHFVTERMGVYNRMHEDLSGPLPGQDYRPIDTFHGLIVYRLLAKDLLQEEIQSLHRLAERDYRHLYLQENAGLGLMLWLSHFFPNEPWAMLQRERSLKELEPLWHPAGFYHQPLALGGENAFANYCISLGLQAVGRHLDRVAGLNRYFEYYRSGSGAEQQAATQIMACVSAFPGMLLRRPDPTRGRVEMDNRSTQE